MTKAIRVSEPGGPEKMKLVDITLEEPAPGQVKVRHTAIGVNFIDTYHRSGLYPIPFPSGLGLEAAGEVTALGDGVTHLKIGDRVAYGSGPLGAYSEEQNTSAARVAKIPDGVSDEEAACLMMKGMTVRYLFKGTYKVQARETILFHAAAGGVGLLACQWAKDLGVTLIGTVSTEEKAELAKANGCAHVINYSHEDIAKRVKEITDGKGVPVVYDGVGKDTFIASLDCLQPRGLLVSFGNASGPVTNVDLGILATKGSLYVTRPTMIHYTMTQEDFDETAADVFDAVARGAIKVNINQRYPLSQAARAHEDLSARKTTGASILLPGS